MACLVSFNFSFRLRRASEIESKLKPNYGSSPCKAALQGRASFHNIPNISSLANKKTVELTSQVNASRSVYTMTSQDILQSRSRLPRCASCIFIIDENDQAVISGYWSGPDFEDGWGFVEAYIYQIH